MALLALAADRGEKTGECLTPTAMACFLDGTCSREEKDLALKHISLCLRCYGEWMALVDLRIESGRSRRTKERRPFLLRPASLAAFAAAMAAMVSIGIFLDITPFSYRIDSGPAPPVATMPEKSAAPPAPARPKEPPGLPAEVEEKAEGKVGPATPENIREQAGIQSQIPPALPFRQWRQELTAVCRGKEGQAVERILFRKLFDEGKSALPGWQQESPATSADRSLRELLLPLLEQARDEEHLLEHCREIVSAVPRYPNSPDSPAPRGGWSPENQGLGQGARRWRMLDTICRQGQTG